MKQQQQQKVMGKTKRKPTHSIFPGQSHQVVSKQMILGSRQIWNNQGMSIHFGSNKLLKNKFSYWKVEYTNIFETDKQINKQTN